MQILEEDEKIGQRKSVKTPHTFGWLRIQVIEKSEKIPRNTPSFLTCHWSSWLVSAGVRQELKDGVRLDQS